MIMDWLLTLVTYIGGIALFATFVGAMAQRSSWGLFLWVGLCVVGAAASLIIAETLAQV